MRGGIGGGAGGTGGAGGDAGTTAQSCTSTPAAMHVDGHSWLIAVSSFAGGANATVQPTAIARSLK
eukprot:5690394-Prymnesium_polylepis.1